MKKLSFVCICFLIAGGVGTPVFGHKDTIIRLQGSKLVGLPEQYQPAELDLSAFRLRIGGRTTVFSHFLKSLFDQRYDFEASASWYNRSRLPSYLSLHISPKGKDYSYSI